MRRIPRDWANLTEKMRGSRSKATRTAAISVVESLETRALLSSSPAVDPGNTTATAYNAGTLTTVSPVLSGAVGTGDTEDYFQFSVAATAKVKVVLGGLTGDADALLLDSQGNTLYFSTNSGTTAESIIKFLDPGKYYVDVLALKTSAANYTLSLTATAPLSTESGHSRATAKSLGNPSGTSRTLTGTLSPTYLDSYYKFVLTTSETVKAIGTGMPFGTSTIAIEDGSGNIVASPDQLYSTSINTQLSPGTYYLHLQSQDVPTGTFSVSFVVSGAAAPDGAGNTPAAARNLGFLSSTQILKDQVSDIDSSDYYIFTIGAAQTVTMTLTGLTGDADLALLGGDLSVVALSSNTALASESIKTSLAPGKYYVDVMIPEIGQANYTLTLTPSVQGGQAPDNAGNKASVANNVGVLNGTFSFGDYVGPTDTNDYYKFTLTNKSNVTIGLGSMTANADIQLIASSGTVITSSNKTGITADSIAKVLAVGTYYVRVFPVSTASTNYALTLTGAIYDGAGNTLAAANLVGALSGSKQFGDFIGTTDTDDYYKFTLAIKSNVTGTLNGLSSNADLLLLDSNGLVLGSSTNPGTAADVITRTLNPGTYYAHILSASPATNYTFTLAATIYDGAGNTLATANNLNLLSGTVAVNDWVGTTDTNDYYLFNVTSKTDATFALTGLTANADLQLLSANGSVLLSSVKTGTAADSISAVLSPGTYFARVFPVSTASTPYLLTLTGTLHDAAGNTLATASSVGLLVDTQTINDSVSSTDSMDYYKFTALENSTANISIAGLSAAATLSLLDSSGNTIATGANISKAVTAGTTYYVLVSTVAQSTPYSLTISGPQSTGVGNFIGTKNLSGSLSSGAAPIIYTFSLSATANVTLAVGGLFNGSSANLKLLNSSATLLGQTTATSGGGAANSLVKSLSAGTYYVLLTGDSTTNYTLAVTVPPPSDDTLAGATAIGTLSATTFTFHNAVSSTDVTDYYKFTVTASHLVNVSLSGLTADGNISLLGTNGTSVLVTSAHTGTVNESIVTTLAAGTYYIRVYAGSTVGTSYTLTVK